VAAASLAVTIATGAWTVALLTSGGLNLVLLGVAIRAHGVSRPVTVGVAAFVVFLWSYGIGRAIARVAAAPGAIVVVLAGAVLTLGVTRATCVAGGSDSYGYLSQAELWRSGLPIVSQPWTLDVPWPNANSTFIPLGYRPAQQPGAMVPGYAAGFPLLLAAVESLGGHAAMFWLVPIAGALLVLVAYGVGRALGSTAAGLAGAWLVATNATLLGEVTAPMSDVVAAAALAGSCCLILRPDRRAAAAGGLLSALAILVRPNLAGTVCVMAIWLASRRAGGVQKRDPIDLTRALIFAVAASPGFLVSAWINWRFYGSPLVSGYGSLQSIYHWSNVLPNLQRYVRLIIGSGAPLALAGFAALLVPRGRLWPEAGDRSVFTGIAVFVFSLVAQYLAYEPATGGGYLRFLLPCWPIVMVAAAQVVLRVSRAPRYGWARAVVGLALVAYGAYGIDRLSRSGGLQDWRGEHRYPTVATLARARTDPSSVFFSGQHSGSIRYYGGRITLRYDMMDPAWLDRSIAWLAAHGAHPYALLDDDEVKLFRQRFKGQERVSALDMPIFVYHGAMVVHFYDLLRTADDPSAPEFIIDRFDGPRRQPPVALPPFAFGR
jgi:hypothetical protein